MSYSDKEKSRYSQKSKLLLNELDNLKIYLDYDYTKLKLKFQELYSQNENDTGMCFAYASLLDWHDENQLAIPILKESINKASNYQYNLSCQLAWAIADKGREGELEESKRLINESKKYDSKNHCIKDTKAWIEYRQGNYDEAYSILSPIVDVLSIPEIDYHFGAINFALNNHFECNKYLISALSFPREFSGRRKAKELLDKNLAQSEEKEKIRISSFHAGERGLTVTAEDGHTIGMTWDRIWELADSSDLIRRFGCRLNDSHTALVWRGTDLELDFEQLRDAAMHGNVPPEYR